MFVTSHGFSIHTCPRVLMDRLVWNVALMKWCCVTEQGREAVGFENSCSGSGNHIIIATGIGSSIFLSVQWRKKMLGWESGQLNLHNRGTFLLGTLSGASYHVTRNTCLSHISFQTMMKIAAMFIWILMYSIFKESECVCEPEDTLRPHDGSLFQAEGKAFFLYCNFRLYKTCIFIGTHHTYVFNMTWDVFLMPN